MKLDIESLLFAVMESMNATYDYYKSSKNYYQKYGHCVRLDSITNKEEAHIDYCYHCNDREQSVVYALCNVLALNKEQINRLYLAARSLQRWYCKTDWQICPSKNTIERLWSYIIG